MVSEYSTTSNFSFIFSVTTGTCSFPSSSQDKQFLPVVTFWKARASGCEFVHCHSWQYAAENPWFDSTLYFLRLLPKNFYCNGLKCPPGSAEPDAMTLYESFLH